MPWDDRWYGYPKSVPKKAKGGIKAQSGRGGFAKSWWAQRWISVLESFDIGARLERGRRYARTGQVLSIDIDRELVTAEVQGSRTKPYKVVIRVKALAREDWQKLAACLAQQAIFAAKLLAGEMPPDIESAFADAGLSLFPQASEDLETVCSCPDWSNPCKHIAAVYYLLGEEFDRDPFVLFKLRGMEREELIGLVGGPEADVQAEAGEEASEPAAAEPLPTDPPTFWHPGKLPDDLYGEVRVPTLPAALVRRLGNFPFWRGSERFLEAMEPLYREASREGMEAFLEGPQGGRHGAR
jgi:uncharacterized Zn finger protein